MAGGSALKKLKSSISELNKSTKSRIEKRKSLNPKNNPKNNPFELKFARQKHQVLNRKVKGVVGKPGLTRKRSDEARNKTLLVEMNRRNKVSSINDKRFGESDKSMSTEDKMLERFMKEKSKRTKTSGQDFNLEEEDLTHMGQSLTDDAFEKAGFMKLNDSDDEGNIEKDVVRRAHFGGFNEDEEDVDPTKRKSKNDIYQEIIAKSKMHKHERQALKQQDEELAMEVDAQLDDIRELLSAVKPESQGRALISSDRMAMIEKNLSNPEQVKMAVPAPLPRLHQNPDDDYDRFVKELIYEKRAKPTDRLKTEEELAIEEKIKLENLEKERIRRMNGIQKPDSSSKKKSRVAQADDLEDDFEYNDSTKTVDSALVYKDGVLQNSEIVFSKRKRSTVVDADDSDIASEDENDSASGSGSESESESGSENDVEEDIEEDVDGLDESESEKESESGDESISGSESQVGSDEDITMDESVELAAKELPYTFKAPKTIIEFQTLIANRSNQEIGTIIQRLRILFNRKISGDNRGILKTLAFILYEYLDLITSKDTIDNSLVMIVVPHVIALSSDNASNVAEMAILRIKNMRSTLVKNQGSKNGSMPSASDLLFMKIMTILFPGSDKIHAVMTPLILLMCQYLAMAAIKTTKDVAKGLFICELLYETQKLSKRYIPEVVNFLYSILVCFQEKGNPISNFITIRCKLDELSSTIDLEPQQTTFEIFSKSHDISSQQVSKLLVICLESVLNFARIYGDTPTFIETFEEFLKIMESFKSKSIIIQEKITETIDFIVTGIKKMKSTRMPLQFQKRKAVAMATFVPKFQENYSIDKHYNPNKEKADMAKLKFEYKKELKGAARELRKDGEFIAREKLKQTKLKDQEYKKKIDKIMGQLTSQEGAMRGYEREKKKPRKKN